MTVPVITHPEAEEDIRQARAWYDDISPVLGEDFVGCVLESLELIGRHPGLYAGVGGGLRRAFVRRFPYHVYYRIGTAFVGVLAVCHSHSDRRRLLRQAARRVF